MFEARRFRLVTIACAVLCALALPAAAQSWSDEQTEVWSFISAQWEKAKNKDSSWIENDLHSAFQGWDRDNPAPRDKASTAKWDRYTSKNSTTMVQELFPLRIVVTGDTAVAHYLYQIASEDKEGERESTSGRYTDILIKTKSGWKFIAWSGGDDPEDD